MMGVVLLASATITSIRGFLASMPSSHEPFGAPRLLACSTTALRDRGKARMVGTIGESTRQIVAVRIKSGSKLDAAEIGHASDQSTATPARDMHRSRLGSDGESLLAGYCFSNDDAGIVPLRIEARLVTPEAVLCTGRSAYGDAMMRSKEPSIS
jgi:hypothetical protein